MYKYNKIKRFIASLLAVLTLATCLSVGSVAYAEDLVAINENNFADKNFRTIISEIYDVDQNGYLDATERKVTYISLSGYLEEVCGPDATITDLKGIEYFYNLSNLYCAGIGLETLDVHQNTKLTRLTCGGNLITSLTLGSLAKLVYLDCSVNELTALDLSGVPALKTLNCNTNKIANIDLSVVPGLTTLYINQNELISLDVSSNTALINLQCTYNHIKELDLSSNTALVEITEQMIGNQWVNLDAYVSANKIYINVALKNQSALVSSSLDTVVETEEGEEIVSAYSNGKFCTDEADCLAGKLKNADLEEKDGFVYKYNVNNAACDDMTVNVETKRNFYQVNFYLDSTMTSRLSYNLVIAGSSATAPELPEASSCKEFVSWSEDYTSVNNDMDVYIIWRDNHNIIKDFNNTTGVIDIHCTKCHEKDICFNFSSAYNKKRGEIGYDEVGDVNNDGVVNAKDYALLLRM